MEVAQDKGTAPGTVAPFVCFREACSQGQLAVAQWLLAFDLKPSGFNATGRPSPTRRLYSPAEWRNVLADTCAMGHLAVVQWLIDVNPDMDISAENDNAFRQACSKGHLCVAQYLFAVKPDIRMNRNPCIFTEVCSNGHLSVAQWLNRVNTDEIDITDAYLSAYSNRHRSIIQWLVSLNKDIDLV